MNKIILNITAVFIIATVFVACTKHTSETTDTTKPVITVVEPMADDTLSLAVEPEIHIEFTVTDETGLHELNVLLIKNNVDTLMNESPAVHDLKTYSFHEHAIPTGISSLTPMKAILTAEDHGENKEVKTISFFITP